MTTCEARSVQDMGSKQQVCVLGAGVIGLSTAVRILEESERWGMAGKRVEVKVVAERYTPNTTSDGSAGFWNPYKFGDNSLFLVRRWSEATWHHLRQLALSAELAGTLGAQFVSGYHLSDSPTTEDPSYKDTVLGFRHVTSKELSLFPGARSGFFMTTLQINVQKYLPWLMQRFKEAGGKIEIKTVQNLEELAEDYDVVVNCAGLGSGSLVSDPHVLPVRGQLRRVAAPWIKHFYIFLQSDGDMSYILPLDDVAVVGGVAQRHNWNETVDKGDSQALWNRATSHFPFIKSGRTVREWAGLRPGRTSVRLEAGEKIHTAGGRVVPVVHNYGHGGSGVTFHWGCAGDAADLVRSALLNTPPPLHSKL